MMAKLLFKIHVDLGKWRDKWAVKCLCVGLDGKEIDEVVYGPFETKEEAEKEHTAIFNELIAQCKERGGQAEEIQ